MNDIKRYLTLAIEQLEIDKVVDAIEDNQPIEKIISDVEIRLEDTSEGTKQTEEAQNLSSEIDDGEKATAALEELADLIEQTENLGGMSDKTADMANTSISAVCSSIGVGFESIDSQKFNSFSKRLVYTQESVSSIKEVIGKVWKMIIEGLKKLIDFIKKAIRFYESDMFKHKQELENLKSQFRNTSKVEPEIGEIKGVVAQILLLSKENKSSDVLAVANVTSKTMLDFVSTFRRDLGSSVTSIRNFSDTVLDIPLDGDKEVEYFTKDKLANFGQFFGTQLSARLNAVNDTGDVLKPSNTMSCFESNRIAGGYKFTMFVPNNQNIISEDILLSRMFFAAHNNDDAAQSVNVCDINDFRKLFAVTDEMIVTSRRCYEAADYMEKEISKVLKQAESAYSTIGKTIYTVLDKANIPSNQRFGVPVYNTLSLTLKRFYNDPMLNVLKYVTRYVKVLNTYAALSLKEYA